MSGERVRPSLDGELVSEVREAARSELATPPEKATVPAALRGLLRRLDQLEEERDELKARLGEDETHDLAADMARLHKAGRELRRQLKPSPVADLLWKELHGETGNHRTRQVDDPLEAIDVPEGAPDVPTIRVKIRDNSEDPFEERERRMWKPDLSDR